MKITVKSSSGADTQVEVDDGATVMQLKAALTEETGVSGMRLIFGGKILKDAQLLADAGLRDGQALHSVGGAQRGAATHAVDGSTSGVPATSAAAAPAVHDTLPASTLAHSSRMQFFD